MPDAATLVLGRFCSAGLARIVKSAARQKRTRSCKKGKFASEVIAVADAAVPLYGTHHVTRQDHRCLLRFVGPTA